MAGSTTGVSISPWYGGYQTAVPSPYYKIPYAKTGYYTTKALQCCTTTCDAPSYFTETPKYKTRSNSARATSPKIRSITPRLPSTTLMPGILHDYVCCPWLQHQGP